MTYDVTDDDDGDAGGYNDVGGGALYAGPHVRAFVLSRALRIAIQSAPKSRLRTYPAPP